MNNSSIAKKSPDYTAFARGQRGLLTNKKMKAASHEDAAFFI
jgi:hypothetical protein